MMLFMCICITDNLTASVSLIIQIQVSKEILLSLHSANKQMTLWNTSCCLQSKLTSELCKS